MQKTMKMLRWGLVGLAVAVGLVGAARADSWIYDMLPWSKKTAAAEPAAGPAPVAGEGTEVKPDMSYVGQPLDIQPNDRVLGSMTAPVTMIEYASLTCSHCADFERETLPQVKKEWIETGKVKYVLRDLPWDNLALGMAKIARCAPPAQFEPLVEAFFAGQATIVMSNDPLGEIKKVAAQAGFSSEQVDGCIRDVALHAQITGSKEIARTKLGVTGTPALFINGTKLDGAVPYKDLKKTLEAEYAKAKK
jgi:protein-disulfide isomerase